MGQAEENRKLHEALGRDAQGAAIGAGGVVNSLLTVFSRSTWDTMVTGPSKRVVARVERDMAAKALAALEAGADPSCDAGDGGGWLPLHSAARYNHVSVVGPLLQRGASVNARTKSGDTPLQLAAQQGHAAIVTMLLAHGADVNAKDVMYGIAALALATENAAIMAELLDKGAEINAQQNDGWSALHRAAYSGNTASVELLLKRGANANITNNDGDTPMHLAARDGKQEAVQLLVKHGADTSIKNKAGALPLDPQQSK